MKPTSGAPVDVVSHSPIDALPHPRFDHLRRMTSRLGIWEHARYTTPRTGHGLCTDDNARALIVVCRQPDPSPDLLELGRTYLAFLEEAALPAGGFHNRMSADGSWTDRIGSDDSQGRAIWSLGSAVGSAPQAATRDAALELFERQLPFASPSPRANAFAVLGAAEVLVAGQETLEAGAALSRWVSHLRWLDDPVWPWPETRLAYDNARIPEALMAAGHALGDADLVETGIRLLDWLVSVETLNGHFSFTPVGGWAPGERRPGFDQQPVEAAAMADACFRAWSLTGDVRWKDRVSGAARWLVGSNDRAAVLYDFRTGGCRDGLTPAGTNLNQGAESTLAALSTLQRAYESSEEAAESPEIPGSVLAQE